MTPTVQWEAVAGVTHAWIAQCEGYVSLCGHEVSGFGGQRSGIRCGQCSISVGWAEQTGESSYVSPQEPFAAMEPKHVHVHGTPRPIHPRPARRPPPAPREDAAPIGEVFIPSFTLGDPQPLPAPALRAPETMEAYQELPMAEQRYWAPVMLARTGQEAVWDQSQETAEQFQQRCYAQVQTCQGAIETP